MSSKADYLKNADFGKRDYEKNSERDQGDDQTVKKNVGKVKSSKKSLGVKSLKRLQQAKGRPYNATTVEQTCSTQESSSGRNLQRNEDGGQNYAILINGTNLRTSAIQALKEFVCALGSQPYPKQRDFHALFHQYLFVEYDTFHIVHHDDYDLVDSIGKYFAGNSCIISRSQTFKTDPKLAQKFLQAIASQSFLHLVLPLTPLVIIAEHVRLLGENIGKKGNIRHTDSMYILKQDRQSADLLKKNVYKCGCDGRLDTCILKLLEAYAKASGGGKLSNERKSDSPDLEGPASSCSSSSYSAEQGYDPCRAVHTGYAQLRQRRDSFALWPDTHAQSPQELAVAGFFYTGHADCVRCHYCDLALKHWDLNHQPLQEHARHSPSCGYVRFVCRDDFINGVLALMDKGTREQLGTIRESARELSTGEEIGIPRSDTPGRRTRLPRPNKSPHPVKCCNKVVRVWFPHCGHFVLRHECAPPPSRCPACPHTDSPKVIPAASLRAPERNAPEEGPTDVEQADMDDNVRPAASERVAGERGRPSSDPLQSNPNSTVDLREARSRRDAEKISALVTESSPTKSKTDDTLSERSQNGNDQGFMPFDVELGKMCALCFPLNTDTNIQGTMRGKGDAAFLPESRTIGLEHPADNRQDTFVTLHQKKALPIQGDDGRPETRRVTDHVPLFPKATPDRLHESDNNAFEVLEGRPAETPGQSRHNIQDVLHAIQEAWKGIKHPFVRQMLTGWRPLLQEINALPVVPQSTEEGLTRVDFRSPDRERMNVEGFRVGTFLFYNQAENHAVLRLANAGFYHTGRGDTLACFCCDATFSYADRRQGEDPYVIHRELNPNCPHLTGRDTANVFIQDEQTRAESGRDITGPASEGNEADLQLVSEAIARIRSAMSIVYTLASVPNVVPRNPGEAIIADPDLTAENNNTHSTNFSFEEPRPGQNTSNPLIERTSYAYENNPVDFRERRALEGNNDRSRQGNPSVPQFGNPPGQQNPSAAHQTSQAGANGLGQVLNHRSTNTQERPGPVDERSRVPAPPQPTAQVHVAFLQSAPNRQPPASAPSSSSTARQGEVSSAPDNTAAAVPDYDPSRAVHTQYTDLERRELSFRQWPDTHAQSPQDLAVAGFFFTGVGDSVRCHYCGLGLKHWDPDDRPLDEHVRWRSSCGYLRALLGDADIYRTLARIGRGQTGETSSAPLVSETVVATVLAQPPTAVLAQPPTAVLAQPPTAGLARPSTAVLGSNGSRQTAAPQGEAADLMTSEAAEAARAMGFPNGVIERAIRALLSTRAGLRAVTTQNLANAILYLQARSRDPDSPEPSDDDNSDNDDDDNRDDDRRPGIGGGDPDDNTPPQGHHTPSNSGDEGPSPAREVVRGSSQGPGGPGLQTAPAQPPHSGNRRPNRESQQTLRELEQENQELRERRRCKICLDNDVSILFLPCGHLVCCAECAPALRRCPMCRKRITGTVRIQLSALPPDNNTH